MNIFFWFNDKKNLVLSLLKRYQSLFVLTQNTFSKDTLVFYATKGKKENII